MQERKQAAPALNCAVGALTAPGWKAPLPPLSRATGAPPPLTMPCCCWAKPAVGKTTAITAAALNTLSLIIVGSICGTCGLTVGESGRSRALTCNCARDQAVRAELYGE